MTHFRQSWGKIQASANLSRKLSLTHTHTHADEHANTLAYVRKYEYSFFSCLAVALSHTQNETNQTYKH